MNRRLLAAVAAVLLAVAGGWVILGYVGGAESRAQAAEELTPVLVVDSDVPAGTPVADLGSAVSTQQVPARLVGSGTLSDLSSVQGMVTTVELLPGEMVQSGRFGAPDAARADGSLPAPDGTEEVSLSLERQRAVGGALVPGDVVGVFGTASGLNDGPDISLQLDGVVVTRVSAPADAEGVWTITLALGPDAASAVSAAQSKGTVYLSLQAAGTPSAEHYSGSTADLTGGGATGTPSGSSAPSATSGGNS